MFITLRRVGTRRDVTAGGFVTYSDRYRAECCEGCPLRGSCFKAKGDRIIEVNHQLQEYKQKARELLTSEEGIRYRGLRCIEPEAVFGQMKYNKAYRRFRHFWKDKVMMDFAFFAIAFNIGKMCKRTTLKEIRAAMEALMASFTSRCALLVSLKRPSVTYGMKLAA